MNMKRFFLMILSALILIVCVIGAIFAVAGFDDSNIGMAIVGCIIVVFMLLFFVICQRKAKALRSTKPHAKGTSPRESADAVDPKEALSEKYGIDYVVNVGRKGSVYIMMVHYKSGKVKRVRTRFDSLEFRHYAKYIKQ